jgi:glycine hydroxymethyltransferase
MQVYKDTLMPTIETDTLSTPLETADHELFTIIKHEALRQEHTVNLIASENYTPKAVLEATGSMLTNKYAEGYPGKRYYAGCEWVDKAESLAIDRCKALFGAEHANVQPHAGSQANMAAYLALLNPGDTIMGMSLSEGGHLTHGHAVNFSGKMYKVVQYKVNRDTELLDFDEIEQLANEHKPKLIIAGASAYSRAIDFERFAAIAHRVGAFLLADIAHIAGLVAAKLHPDPVPYADVVTSTTHKTLRGPRGALILSKQELAEKIDRAIMPGSQGGPFMHTIAAKAVAFKLAQESSFASYQQQVINNAQTMAQAMHDLGYRLVAGGTDNHLFIADVRSKGITGLQAQIALEKAGITVSRSCIPFDPAKPWITSGIRVGTPCITTRGMGTHEALEIAHLIDEAIKHHDNDLELTRIKQHIVSLCKKFPIYDF